jgi:type II secretory pathway predicted ATPase ExeA
MYNKFFGFKEKPFKLVPNPEYLFLSKSHEEALGHLTYAISHGDGFVEITGEVGTGKTTLCRVFLGGLDKSIEAAYIFNPKLDAMQLLKAINDELGIDSKPDNTKDLIDILNGFLIEKKASGQKVLVLIDEAQNLSLEVLEQLRLLSNLETTQEKLLQIILVGQPELGDMLSSHQLRQLGQRITINCQLDPLTFQEAMDYIRHRISLASHRAGPPFDKSSYRAIYEYSRGIPRLINIACDRILLNAFTRNSFKVNGSITKEAIKELTRKKSGASHGLLQGASGLTILSAILIPLIILILYLTNGQSLKKNTITVLPPPQQANKAEIKQAVPETEPVIFGPASPETTVIPQKEASIAIEEKILPSHTEKPFAPQTEKPAAIQEDRLSSSQPEEFNSNEEAPISSELIELTADKLRTINDPLAENEKQLHAEISEDTVFHSVHVGTSKTASQANRHVEKLKALGYPSFMYTKKNSPEDTAYVVVAGKYPSYYLAKEASRGLSNEGYNNFIARAKDSLAAGPTSSTPTTQTNTSEQWSQTSGETQNFLNYLQGLHSRSSRNNSMEHILTLWFPKEKSLLKQNGIDSTGIFFREAANHFSLLVQPVATESDLQLIKNLNVPAIFTFYIIGHTWPKYLAVTAIDNRQIYFIDGDQNKITTVSKDEFLKYWSGEAYIFWKNFKNLKGMITQRSNGKDIRNLKQFLQELGYKDIPLTDKYDNETMQVIKDIQTKYGLHVDGMVGSLTKIALYNEGSEFIKPSLVKLDAAKTENGS